MSDEFTVSDDLMRTALDYASGNLSAPERAAFERELEQDENAALALADAALVCAAVTLETAAARTLRHDRRSRAMATGMHGHLFALAAIAAVLFLALGLISYLGDSANDAVREPQAPSHSEQLVAAWVELGDEEYDTDEEPDEDLSVDDGTPPGWLLLAVEDED